MREIKFRLWDKDKKEMLYPRAIYSFYNHALKFEVMQFTGLLDKNEKEIYEGDIVKYIQYTAIPDHIGVVVFDQNLCGFAIKEIENEKILWYFAVSRKENIQVVGNIYENQELIKEQP